MGSSAFTLPTVKMSRVVTDLPGGALWARPAHDLLPVIDVVHCAEHESHLAQSAGQRDADVPRLDQPACHLRHQRKVQEVVGRIDHHDLGRLPDQPGQLPRGVETGESRPGNHYTVFVFMSCHLGSPASQRGMCTTTGLGPAIRMARATRSRTGEGPGCNAGLPSASQVFWPEEMIGERVADGGAGHGNYAFS
jgi:hypothetical protein